MGYVVNLHSMGVVSLKPWCGTRISVISGCDIYLSRWILGFWVWFHIPFLTSVSIGPDVVCTWSGQLPPRRHKNPTFSPRVFLGGVPWDITESGLLQTFQVFGNLVIDWPGKENKHCRHPPKGKVLYVHFCILCSAVKIFG